MARRRLEVAYELGQEFADMARERTGQRFDAWLTRVTTSGIPELDRFARGLADDRAAVEAALSMEWSNGQTEGQVNKLKLLKRSMYGRYVIWNLALRDVATSTRFTKIEGEPEGSGHVCNESLGHFYDETLVLERRGRFRSRRRARN